MSVGKNRCGICFLGENSRCIFFVFANFGKEIEWACLVIFHYQGSQLSPALVLHVYLDFSLDFNPQPSPGICVS